MVLILQKKTNYGSQGYLFIDLHNMCSVQCQRPNSLMGIKLITLTLIVQYTTRALRPQESRSIGFQHYPRLCFPLDIRKSLDIGDQTIQTIKTKLDSISNRKHCRHVSTVNDSTTSCHSFNFSPFTPFKSLAVYFHSTTF